jgi:hypothetical protein
MRGAERPASIQWTRPFLAPLKPLTQDAARRAFIDVTDDGHPSEAIDKILLLADNMPLAINLMAHLVDHEGAQSVLNRWETQKTSLLSDGNDKGSNLDLSISLSLESPRLASLPQSRYLLSLLSILPDGLSDIELLQTEIPVSNILACKAALLSTSLIYIDDRGRLKTLVPIREYMQSNYPPKAYLVHPLLQHYQELLKLHMTYHGTLSNPEIVARISANSANIHSILLQGLNYNNPDLENTIYCACDFDDYSISIGHGPSPLLDQIPHILPQPKNHRLEVHFVRQIFCGRRNHFIRDVDRLVHEAMEHFIHFDDPELKCGFYISSSTLSITDNTWQAHCIRL